MTTLMLRRLLSVVLTTFLIGVLAACGGGGGSGSELPDAAGSSESADPDSEDADISAADARLKFAACMRENGIDMPDPGPDGEVMLDSKSGDWEQLEAAHEACEKWMELAMPEDGKGPEMSEEHKQALLDMAQCMRDKGYDFSDPKFEGGRITQRVEGFSMEDPAVQSDLDECQGESGVGGDIGLTGKES